MKKITGKLTAEDKKYLQKVVKESYGSLIKLSDHFYPHHKVDNETGKIIPPADIHYEFEALLRGTIGKKGDVNSKYNLLSILPRGCAKTTYASLFFITWLLLFSNKRYIVFIGASADSIKGIFDSLKFEIKNNTLLHSFDIKPCEDKDSPDNATTFDVDALGMPGISYMTGKRTVRIEAYGINQFNRGKKFGEVRPDMIIMDDLEIRGSGNKAGVENKKYRETLRRKFDSEIVPSMGKEGSMQIVMVGTVMNESMLLWKLYESALEGTSTPKFKAIKYSLIENFGQEDAYSIWPEMKSIEYLEGLLQTMRKNGTQNDFFNEYLSEPTSPDDVIFKKENFKYFDDRGGVIEVCDQDGKPDSLYKRVKLKDCKIVITTDIAFTVNQRSDDTAICIVAIDCEDNKYILDIVHGKFQAIETISYMRDICIKYEPIAVGIESASGGAAIINLMERELRGLRQFPGITELKPAGLKKNDRIINKLQVPYLNGSIYHKFNGAYVDELEYQILNVTKDDIKCEHDDLVDALSYVYDVSEYGAIYANNNNEVSFYQLMSRPNTTSIQNKKNPYYF